MDTKSLARWNLCTVYLCLGLALTWVWDVARDLWCDRGQMGFDLCCLAMTLALAGNRWLAYRAALAMHELIEINERLRAVISRMSEKA